MNRCILPPAMLGILGGGQLGRMFTVAAKTMGYRVTVLDPDPAAPAAAFADRHLCAPFDDQAALDELAACAAVTTEFENVSADAMRTLAKHTRVSPSGDAVAIAQDRLLEKSWIQRAGLPTVPWLALQTTADLDDGDLTPCLPGILKTARLGYDGKGQARVDGVEQLKDAYARLGAQPCVLERRVDLHCELSVVLARDDAGDSMCFPVAENCHRHGILDVSIVPARVDPALAVLAQQMARQLADALDYVGVLAVELFVLGDGSLVVNEIAPRPHNSGHYTLDACACDQFQQQVRVLCGLPAGAARLLSPAAMVNLLGDLWPDGGQPDWLPLLATPGAHLHLYGKQQARPGRKMGHYTVLAESADAALEQAETIQRLLGGAD